MMISNHEVENRPNKLKHIKNLIILNNCYDPFTGKYIKKIRDHGITKLNRPISRLIWEYYSDSKKNYSAVSIMRDSFYKNIPNISIIYFDDPTIRKITLTKEMMATIKEYENTIHPKETKAQRVTKKVNRFNLIIAKKKRKINRLQNQIEELSGRIIEVIISVEEPIINIHEKITTTEVKSYKNNVNLYLKHLNRHILFLKSLLKKEMNNI